MDLVSSLIFRMRQIAAYGLDEKNMKLLLLLKKQIKIIVQIILKLVKILLNSNSYHTFLSVVTPQKSPKFY